MSTRRPAEEETSIMSTAQNPDTERARMSKRPSPPIPLARRRQAASAPARSSKPSAPSPPAPPPRPPAASQPAVRPRPPKYGAELPDCPLGPADVPPGAVVKLGFLYIQPHPITRRPLLYLYVMQRGRERLYPWRHGWPVDASVRSRQRARFGGRRRAAIWLGLDPDHLKTSRQTHAEATVMFAEWQAIWSALSPDQRHAVRKANRKALAEKRTTKEVELVTHDRDGSSKARAYRPSRTDLDLEQSIESGAAPPRPLRLPRPRPRPERLPAQAERPPALALVQQWRDALALGNLAAANEAIRRLRQLAERPSLAGAGNHHGTVSRAGPAVKGRPCTLPGTGPEVAE